MWARDLDPHARLRQRRAVHRPGDGRHAVAAIGEGTCQDGEGPNVTGRAHRGEGDPHQMVAMRRGAMRGP